MYFFPFSDNETDVLWRKSYFIKAIFIVLQKQMVNDVHFNKHSPFLGIKIKPFKITKQNWKIFYNYAFMIWKIL